MKVKKTLETLITPIRLGWHGVLALGIGLAAEMYGIADKNATLQLSGSAMLGLGVAFYHDSLKGYVKTRRHIRNHGTLDQRWVGRMMMWYCNRQGARTAAANAGIENQFDAVYDSYKKENTVFFDYLPHI